MNSFIFLFALHKLFALAFLLGLIFFIVWAIKNLKKDDLIKLAVSLIVIGILGGILAMAFGGGYHWKDGKGDFYKDGKGVYNESCWNR